jgi:ABC-type hemin transport system ATPase subunit
VPDGERSTERWLLLDEPEAALDIEAVMIGLSLLIRAAAPAKLRVLCASHGPMFAAGMAEDPNVQVVDLGGAQPWFARALST